MTFSTLSGIVYLLIGLGAAWLGVRGMRADRSPVHPANARPRRRMPPGELTLWLLSWAMMALGFICLGVTVLRYSKGIYVVVPASASLIDQGIWYLFFVGFLGGVALLCTLSVMRQLRARREDASGS